MSKLLCQDTLLKCSFGVAPAPFNVLSLNRVLTCSLPAANIMDNKPMINIPSFGMCNSLANPTVASATAAAMGVLTPMPCIPVTSTPWTPGSPQIAVANMPIVTQQSKCMCNWGGIIEATIPGQMTVDA